MSVLRQEKVICLTSPARPQKVKSFIEHDKIPQNLHSFSYIIPDIQKIRFARNQDQMNKNNLDDLDTRVI